MIPHPFTHRTSFAACLASLLAGSALLSSQLAVAQSPAAGGSVFNVFANGSITLGDQVNTQAYCNLRFYDTPPLNVSRQGLLGSQVCRNNSSTASVPATPITASGTAASRITLPAFQSTQSPLDVNYANSAQVLINDGQRQQQINGDGQLSVTSAGQTLTLRQQGNRLTLPAGDYARVALQVGGVLHFQAGTKGTRIKQLSLANCNGSTMEFEPGDYYIDQASVQNNCHLAVTPVSGNSQGSVNLYFNNSLTLNAGPTCWNIETANCTGNLTNSDLQAQHPERLKLYLYRGDFTTYQGARIAGGIYADQGDIRIPGAENLAFTGEAIARNISTANANAIYAYRPVFSQSNGGNATPPAISITPPAPNITYTAPATVTLSITASATGNSNRISKIDLYNGSTLVATSSSPDNNNGNSYSLSWKHIPAGSYSLTAVATDSTGQTARSAPVAISVINNNPPVVSLTANPDKAIAPATILLNASASDSDGSISKVQFYNGATLIASVSQAPYTSQWNNIPAGDYSLTATATDNLGASTTSAAIKISVTDHSVQVYDIHTDQINTPRVITDKSGNIVWRWDSLPFGESPADENPRHNGAENNFRFNLRFPGQYYDEETGLHYNYYRDYDPQAGRYIQSDPIGLNGGSLSTYDYVNGRPFEQYDQFGLAPGLISGNTVNIAIPIPGPPMPPIIIPSRPGPGTPPHDLGELPWPKPTPSILPDWMTKPVPDSDIRISICTSVPAFCAASKIIQTIKNICEKDTPREECKKDCVDTYDRDVEECSAYYKIFGKKKYSVCMARAGDYLDQCMRKCDGK